LGPRDMVAIAVLWVQSSALLVLLAGAREEFE
jgi:hypothetical protein